MEVLDLKVPSRFIAHFKESLEYCNQHGKAFMDRIAIGPLLDSISCLQPLFEEVGREVLKTATSKLDHLTEDFLRHYPLDDRNILSRRLMSCLLEELKITLSSSIERVLQFGTMAHAQLMVRQSICELTVSQEEVVEKSKVWQELKQNLNSTSPASQRYQLLMEKTKEWAKEVTVIISL